MSDQLMTTAYSEMDKISLIASIWWTVVAFIYFALTTPSEDILKAIKEKKRLEKLNKK